MSRSKGRSHRTLLWPHRRFPCRTHHLSVATRVRRTTATHASCHSTVLLHTRSSQAVTERRWSHVEAEKRLSPRINGSIERRLQAFLQLDPATIDRTELSKLIHEAQQAFINPEMIATARELLASTLAACQASTASTASTASATSTSGTEAPRQRLHPILVAQGVSQGSLGASEGGYAGGGAETSRQRAASIPEQASP